MRTVNIHEAKTRFTELLDAVARGEKLLIARAGKPTAMLIPVPKHELSVRRPGALRGRLFVAADFDEELPEDVLRAFEGR